MPLTEKQDTEPLRSWYPLWVIMFCVRLVLFAASPLKTASNSVKIAFGIIPECNHFAAPSNTTIKRWVQKVGYYKLRVPKLPDGWMIIIDASIQMGEKKCVLIVGCRQADFPMNRALTLEDLQVLNLRIVSSLNADIITEILNELSLTIGKIICICSDRGSEMLRGIKNFQINHPEARQVSDTAHRVANFLEAILEKSKRWKDFREQTTQARRRMQNSLVPGFLPPSPRMKARYMNISSLIIWAADILLLLDKENALRKSEIEELRKYLEWLPSYREDIEYWNRLVTIGMIARDIVRNEGMHVNITDSFEQSISHIKIGFRELQFVNELEMFLLEQIKGVRPGERLIGSSEALESLFGKMKYMEYEQTSFGFTSLVLAAIAHVGPSDDSIIQQAVQTIKLSEIEEWSAKEIGKTIQSQRKEVKKIISKLKAEMSQNLGGTLERKVMGF